MNCPLCKSKASFFDEINKRQYFECEICCAIFMNPACYISKGNEIKRYEEHNNNVNDTGYQQFVSPIVEEILSHFNSIDNGLDFGCGTGPVITKLLRDQNYNIATFGLGLSFR